MEKATSPVKTKKPALKAKKEQITVSEERIKEILDLADYLIDGPFIYAERDITLAKRGDMHARRLVAARLNQRVVDRTDPADAKQHNSLLNKLFDDIAKRNANRPGGYTRIIKLGTRHGDNAPMVRIELVEKGIAPEAKPAFQATTAD